jgi:H+/Cl- antiporter ClcA
MIGWAQAHKPQGWQVIFLPILIFTLLGIAAIKFPQLLGNGKNIVQLTFFNQIDTRLLCSLIVLRPLAAAVCLRSGAPGGLFTPTMTLGALLGDALGQLWNHLAPGNEVASYALIGSGAFLAAATLGPLSSIVFLLELTRHADVLIVPLLIAAVGATVTARAWGGEVHILRPEFTGQLPFLSHDSRRLDNYITGGSVERSFRAVQTAGFAFH